MSDNMIMQAASFCIKAHGAQLRKFSGIPYHTHPARVGGRISVIPGATELEVCAGYLHDVIEDTPVTKEELLAIFPSQVVTYVVNLTDVYTKKAFPHLNRSDRRQLEYTRLANQDTWTRKIKLVDRIDNIRDMAPVEDFYRIYCKESQHLLTALKNTDDLLESELRYLIERKF